MRIAPLIVLACLGLFGSTARGESRRTPPPNVLFIAVDDLNDWVGVLGGHPQAKTPNIDRLATRGTLFANAHCQAPLCNPSRASVMTGLRPSTTGLYSLDPWFRKVPALQEVVTLPQHFAASGYRTMTTGKIFHEGIPAAAKAPGVEFEEWGYHGSNGPRPGKKLVETEAKTWLMDWGVYPERDEDVEDTKVADWAVAQLKIQPKENPFFLAVGFRRPHVPCFATQKWFDLYPDDETLVMPKVKPDDRRDTPPFSWYLNWKVPEPRLNWLEANRQWRPLVRSYLASISYVDSQIGRLLDTLEEAGHGERTIVVLWSDHGWHIGEKGITGKNTLWERSTHVPLIFAGPAISKGAKSTRPAELLDIYPTLVELCTLPAKDGLDGHSLVPQLKDANAPREWPAITTHGPNNHSVRSENWRYICYADGSEELYDLQADPNEWNNLAPGSTTPVKIELAKFLPKVNAAAAGEGTTRLIELREGKPFWEGKPIDVTSPPPGAE